MGNELKQSITTHSSAHARAAYRASYFIDDTDCLEHYGVMGMKWGVRKDRKSGSTLQQHMEKRKLKRSIKQAQKQARKQGGHNFRSTGKHMDEVDAKQTAAIKNDADWQKKEATRKKALLDSFVSEKKYLDSLSDANGIESRMPESVRKQHMEVDQKYRNARDAVYNRERAIAKTFTDEYLNAALKDMGYKDIAKGRKLLKTYDLENMALGNSRYDFNKGNRKVFIYNKDGDVAEAFNKTYLNAQLKGMDYNDLAKGQELLKSYGLEKL